MECISMREESIPKKDGKMWAGVWRTLQVTDEELDKLYYKKKSNKVSNKDETRPVRKHNR